MKKLVLFAMLAMVFGLSFVSCSGGGKSEKNDSENIQETGDLSVENTQETEDLSKQQAE
jgi:hypothetical protein